MISPGPYRVHKHLSFIRIDDTRTESRFSSWRRVVVGERASSVVPSSLTLYNELLHHIIYYKNTLYNIQLMWNYITCITHYYIRVLRFRGHANDSFLHDDVNPLEIMICWQIGKTRRKMFARHSSNRDCLN